MIAWLRNRFSYEEEPLKVQVSLRDSPAYYTGIVKHVDKNGIVIEDESNGNQLCFMWERVQMTRVWAKK